MEKERKNEKKRMLTLKDFTMESCPGSLQERVEGFQAWIDQSVTNGHLIFWNESVSAIMPEMTLIDSISKEKRNVISFISNDYLGMSQHEETIRAGMDAVREYGTGACAAPIIGGYLSIHRNLEERIARFTGQEDALIFSSGYGVNVGVLNAILGKSDLALVDLKVHRSVLDGLCNTNVKKLKHNDPDYLEFSLSRAGKEYETVVVVVDGVYSQDGDIAPLPEIRRICKKYNALLFVDDAHGVGVFGPAGRGTAEHFGLLGQVDIITGTFSKSFGCVGGFVAASRKIIQYLRYYANTNVFSAAVTPQVTMSVTKALDLIEEKPEIRSRLWDNAGYLRSRLQEEKFDFGDTVSPIFPVMVKDPVKVQDITRLLAQDNIYALGIIYPAVTDSNSRIRVSVLANHEKKHIDKLIKSLVNIRQSISF